MRKKFMFILLAAITATIGLAACSGGGGEPPEYPDDVIVTGATQKQWAKYECEGREGEYIRIYTQQIQNTGFQLYIKGVLYNGKFTWESDDGSVIYATKMTFSSETPNNVGLPTTAVLYNFNDIRASYIEYDGSIWDFDGSQISSWS